jgi:hypothetical protein
MMAITYETIGLLVFREMASFAMVQELTGGLTVVMWRKLAPWVNTVRQEQGYRSFAEWFLWLAEQLAREGAEKEAYPATGGTPIGARATRSITRARRHHHLVCVTNATSVARRSASARPSWAPDAAGWSRRAARCLAPRREEVGLRLDRRRARLQAD